MPGLKFVSRCQLLFAILMFLGSPGWIGLLIIGTLALTFADEPAAFVRADAGLAVFLAVLSMWFAPKIATVSNILSRAEARNVFGGTFRFAASVAAETIFFILLSQIMWFGHALLIASLPFGRPIEWAGQVRDDHSISLAQAVGAFWPHTLLGVVALGLLAGTHPGAIPYALFLAGGLALSIPLAVITALPVTGRLLTRWGVGRLPEETATPASLKALALPAIDAARASQAAAGGS